MTREVKFQLQKWVRAKRPAVALQKTDFTAKLLVFIVHVLEIKPNIFLYGGGRRRKVLQFPVDPLRRRWRCSSCLTSTRLETTYQELTGFVLKH